MGFFFTLKEGQYMSIECVVAVVKDCDPGSAIQDCILMFLWLLLSTARGVVSIWISLLVLQTSYHGARPGSGGHAGCAARHQGREIHHLAPCSVMDQWPQPPAGNGVGLVISAWCVGSHSIGWVGRDL